MSNFDVPEYYYQIMNWILSAENEGKELAELVLDVEDFLSEKATPDELPRFAAMFFFAHWELVNVNSTLHVIERFGNSVFPLDELANGLKRIMKICDNFPGHISNVNNKIFREEERKKSQASKAGKSRQNINSPESKQKIDEQWETGKFSTKKRCADEEWEACGFVSPDSAYRYLVSLKDK